MEIRTHLKQNNEDIICQNTCESATVILDGKFIA